MIINKKHKISVKHLSEYYDEYINTININIFKFYLDDDGIWRRTELKWLFDYLVEHEEYEKCNVLKMIMKKHYVATNNESNCLNEKLIKYKNGKM